MLSISWYQQLRFTLSVKPIIKTQQLAYVLWFIIQRQAEDSTPQTISSFGVLIFHLNSENALFKGNPFLMIILLFPLLHYSNLTLKSNTVMDH